MIRGAFIALWAAVLAFPAQAEPINGDLCFPMEGWAMVARWNLGTGARSVRDGWLRKEYNDGGWDKMKVGEKIPASEDGTWLRNAFRGRYKSCPDARVSFSGLPGGALVFLNGALVNGAANDVEIPIAGQYRKGTNIFTIFFPGQGEGSVGVPSAVLSGLSGSGSPKKTAALKSWRVRAEKTEKEVPDSWLRKPGSMGWKIRTPFIPSACREWIPRGPLCLKAGIDVPYYWRGRTVSLFLHEFPGAPAVYLNGQLLVGGLAGSGKYDVTRLLKFDGRDTLCVVYRDNPPCESGRDGRWAMAALRWEGGVSLPQFPSGATIFTDFRGGADQEGTRQALRYVSQLVSLSSTNYRLEWASSVPAAYSAGLVANWTAGKYSSSDIALVQNSLFSRVAELRQGSKSPLWMVSPTTVGKRHRLPANERLSAANRKFLARAEEAGFKVVPLFDVMRSALRRQKRWPAQVEWSSETGELTAHGSYLMALAILDTFSMP